MYTTLQKCFHFTRKMKHKFPFEIFCEKRKERDKMAQWIYLSVVDRVHQKSLWPINSIGFYIYLECIAWPRHIDWLMSHLIHLIDLTWSFWWRHARLRPVTKHQNLIQFRDILYACITCECITIITLTHFMLDGCRCERMCA